MDKIVKIAYNRIDRTGKKYGLLTVISYSHTVKNRPWWNCVCDCGNTKVANAHELVSGDTKSCGCQRGVANTIHGETHKTKEHHTWVSIRNKMQQPKQSKILHLRWAWDKSM